MKKFINDNTLKPAICKDPSTSLSKENNNILSFTVRRLEKD